MVGFIELKTRLQMEVAVRICCKNVCVLEEK